MTKEEKLEVLNTAMRQSTRGAAKEGMLTPEGEQFYHFTDEAPRELQDLFIEHYEVRDLDYEIFSDACTLVSEIYGDKPEATEEDAQEEIYERGDHASVYTNARLAYLDHWTEDEISETMREYGLHSIAEACAVWYDKQVENAAQIINGWVNA